MILANRERYGYLLNLFMFRGQFNQSLGNSLADLRPPTAAPADFVVPEEAVAEKKAAGKKLEKLKKMKMLQKRRRRSKI